MPLEVRGGVQKSVAFDRLDGHLVSSSVKDCGFLALRGDFAKPQGRIPLGRDPGLSLHVDDAGRVDPSAVYDTLSGPSADKPTGIRVSPGEVFFGGLALWLSLREPGFCVLSAVGQMADRGIVPGVVEFTGEWRSCGTNGLMGDDGLCVFARPPDQDSTPGQPGGPHMFELFVRSFGSWNELAGRMVQQVKRWDDGRPSGERPAPPEGIPVGCRLPLIDHGNSRTQTMDSAHPGLGIGRPRSSAGGLCGDQPEREQRLQAGWKEDCLPGFRLLVAYGPEKVTMPGQHEQTTASYRDFLRRKWRLLLLVFLTLAAAELVAVRLWDEFPSRTTQIPGPITATHHESTEAICRGPSGPTALK